MDMAKKVKKKPKSRVAKPFNAGTMSNAAFFGMIRACLRKRTMFWLPIRNTKLKARRKCEKKGRQKWEYKCNDCELYYPDKEVSVHHIIEAGKLSSFEDLPGFVQRLFCEEHDLCVLCNNCHLKHHKNE